VDLLVWVVDPQKYADEALHIGYLRRLVGHDSVMLVVLNQIDRLPADEVETCRKDLERLLDSDGLSGVRVLTTSARRGDGVETLRSVLAQVVQQQGAVVDRAVADLDSAAGRLSQGVGDAEPDPRDLPGTEELIGALSVAAGIPVVLDAVAADYERRAAAQTGWPFTRWWRRVRPDPLRRLRLGAVENDLRELTRSSLPAPTPSQRARVELAVRAVTSAAADGLPPRWSDAVRRAATAPEVDLSDALDLAVVGVDLRLRQPAWWSALGAFQVALAASAGLGFLWLAIIGLVGWLGLPALPTPFLGAVPLPTFMLLGGLALGGLTALASRAVVRAGARHRRSVVAG
jgi:hypothetical protein